MDERADVAVVGAGLAGVVAAAELERTGWRVAVFEAAPEVGGRTRTREVEGETVDLGGEMLGTYYRRTFHLAASLGLHVEPTRALRAPILWRRPDGRDRLRRLPRVDPAELLGGLSVFASLERESRRLDVTAPWAAPSARRLDHWPYGTWLRSRGVRGSAYAAAESYIGALVSAPLDQLSLLQIAWWVRKAGGVIPALHSGVQYRIREGAQQLSLRLAGGLAATVATETPVTAIERDGGRVVLSFADGGRCLASAAVIAVPLTAVAAIEFRPGLEESVAAMHRELRFGRIAKVVAVAAAPLTARQALAVGGPSIGAAWRRGERAVEGLVFGDATAQPDAEILADAAAAFGVDGWERGSVTRWNEEPFVRGSYLVPGPGDLTRFGPELRRAQGRVLFAGNERSSAPCTLEGAVESGAEAASRAAALLQQ